MGSTSSTKYELIDKVTRRTLQQSPDKATAMSAAKAHASEGKTVIIVKKTTSFTKITEVKP